MLKNYYEAQERIKEHVVETRVIYGEYLSNKFGGHVFIKLENTQISGSFKARGAFNKMLTLPKEKIKNGVIAASAGNHAQGVAAAATTLGVHSTIVMPKGAPVAKVSATKEYGGDVILYGDNFDEALDYATKLGKKEKKTFIHPFDDEKIIEGQGTVALELVKQLKDIDQVIVPIGGGGLISGISEVMKTLSPKTKVIGVQTSKVSPMMKSFISKKYSSQKPDSTIADGIAVANPGHKTFKKIMKYVDEIVSVSEEEIYNAILTIMEKGKIVSEGAGAVGIAALLSGKYSTKDKTTAIILSGGNIDVTMLESIVNKALILNNRRYEIKINIENKIGEFSKIFEIIRDEGGSIYDVKSGYFRDNLGPTQQAITIVVDVLDKEHGEKIIARLRAVKNMTVKK